MSNNKTHDGSVFNHPRAAIAIILAGVGFWWLIIANNHPVQKPEDSLSAQVSSWSCLEPAHVHDFVPLQSIAPNDGAREIQAREFIELERRKTKDTWDMAAGVFSTQQFQLAGYRNYLLEYKHRATEGVRLSKGGMFPFGGTLEKYVAGLKGDYDEVCRYRNQSLIALADKNDALSLLRTEFKKPWLDPKRRIPCMVKRTLTCKS